METLFLLSFATIVASASAQCLSIAELVCRVSTLSTLCAFITQSVLQRTLDEGNWTIFAPTNRAFFSLGDRIAEIYDNPDVLSDVILYHAVNDVLYSDSLPCAATLEMANGQTSTTECQDGTIYQKGEENSFATMPKIVARNINACNGVIHIVDEVMIPADLPLVPATQSPPRCKTIADIVCESSLFSTLCVSVTEAGIGGVLGEGSWTVFAPTDEAFTNLGDTLDVALADNDRLTDILLYHVIGGVKYLSDFECSASVSMTNSGSTTTVCQADMIFQTGAANDAGSMPQIILPDIYACNGVIHVLDEVLLPDFGEREEPPQEECQSIAEIACSNADLTKLCAALTQAGLGKTLSEGSWTVFAPTNEAFANIGDALSDIQANSVLLSEILLYHVVNDVVFSADLECNQEVLMASGNETRTVCVDETIIQMGKGNDWDAMPQIVSADIEACNGVIHLIDQVILPAMEDVPATDCSTIAEIACSTDDFSTLCAAVTQVGLAGALSEGSWTVFAPSNDAFANLGGTLDAVLADDKLLTEILLHHIVDREVYSDQLRCNGKVKMANRKKTRTICVGESVFQAGKGNDWYVMPEIVSFDMEACNGVIHAVNELILPRLK